MATNTTAPPVVQDRSPEWHLLSGPDVCVRLGVDPSVGLTSTEVEARRRTYGPNKLAEQPKEPAWRAFVRQYRDLMQLVLLGAAVVSIVALQDLSTGIVVLALTVFNALMGLHQEGKAAESVESLRKMLIITAGVRRGGEIVKIPAEELVPGDVVGFEAGDKVPADGRILVAATLEIEEAGLTGESTPAGKITEPVGLPDLGSEVALGDRIDMAYMNSQVTRGRGEIVVTATGMDTEVGHISGMLSGVEQEKSPLTKQLDQLTVAITLMAAAALAAIVILGLVRGEDFNSLFLIGISLAIAAIPTGLPAVVTMLLSTGTQQLAGQGAIVKRLRSVETLGSTSAICSDKTGTLTLNQMTARELVIAGRRFSVDGEGYSTTGRIRHVAGTGEGPLEPFLLPMALANDAVIRDEACIGDPTEGALVVLAAKGGLDVEATRRQYPRLAEVPFDAEYKLMATFHDFPLDTGSVVRCLVKGAPDVLLGRASRVVRADGTSQPMTDGDRAVVAAENDRMAGAGLRVLAVARRDLDPAALPASGPQLLGVVQDLELLALIGIVDPPRKEAKDAIALCRQAGIRVRMITGDHATTAEAIAHHLGIEGRALTGAEFAALPDDQLLAEVDDIGVVARVAPEDKVRLVDVLKRRGQIVAMTGDGVNDAPALARADIGVAMGITGTEVTKDAAEMILTDDNFATIVTAVRGGRGLYDNLMKYVRVQLILLAGFILTFVGAGIFNIANGTPLLPLQILWINFAIDVVLAVGLGFDAEAPGLMQRRPRPPDAPVVRPALAVRLAVAGLLIAIGTLAVVAWAEDEYGAAVATTMGLTAASLLHIVAAIEWRDPTRTVFNRATIANGRFNLLVLTAAGLTLLATGLGILNRILDTVQLSGRQWVVCLLAVVGYLVLSEIGKILVRRFTAHQEQP
ncbi:cation-transporting P-type ATPase [Microlunatus elymi]|uniref:Cation-transporting P-type ATPase n=1 Tax=Microlunatus elymi TaxID=2596828 RepID=A0A516Q4D7_9ACTN|nr:cation-transporting P-type ATPase [Microlunatus elymi]QDP98245.1 cation-transporting P-type ATPase [Microlunatus elymi]